MIRIKKGCLSFDLLAFGTVTSHRAISSEGSENQVIMTLTRTTKDALTRSFHQFVFFVLP